MTTENTIRIFAGAVILASLALGADASPLFLSRYWLWLAAFVGANLFQFGFSGFCPLELVLKKLGVKSCQQPLRTQS
jgi:Inner membrane protein YgaP-like, transmembrane domain